MSLGWTASTDPAAVGYNLYFGVASQTYTNLISVGNATNVTVDNLVPGTTYFFNVKAVDSLGDESPFCNEVSYLVPGAGSLTSTNGSTTTSNPNTAPTISTIADQVIDENSATAPLPFAVGDLETPDSLTVSATSSNPTLVPTGNITLTGVGTNWTVMVTPAPGQTGSATIALTVCDPSLCATMSFQLTVNPLPVITLSSPLSGTSYTAPASVSFAAAVTANGHAITAVQFYNGNTLVGTVKSAPYTFSWAGVAAGSYSLSASAVYDAGASVSSAPAAITVAPAPTLPPPWQTLDIGSVALAGSAVVSNSLYAVTGAGAISGSADNFRFLYQSLSGDGEIKCQFTTLQNTGGNAMGGVMIRESLTSGSRYALMGVSPGGAIRWQRRTKTGSSTSTTKGGTGSLPNVWLRVARTGNTLYGYKSGDGINWTQVGSASISMASNIYIGLAVASGSTSKLMTCTSANVTVVP